MSRPWYNDFGKWLPALAALGGAATYIYLSKDKTHTITGTVSDVFTRGSKLTTSNMGEDGVIIEDPASLIAVAGLQLPGLDGDSYSLARMIRSEGAEQGEIRGHVALNDLRSLGWQSLQYLLTYSNAPWAAGKYGKQYSAQYQTEDGGATWVRSEAAVDSNGKRKVLASQTRRYSTSRDPYMGDAQLALKIINDHLHGIDPTQNAVKFLDVSALSSQEGARSFDSINAQWTGEGLIPYTLPQYGTDLVLYRRG